MIDEFLEQYGYLALLVGTFFEGEAAILAASSLIHRGVFWGPYTVIFGFAGSFISDWIYYLIGRLNGKYFIDKRPKLKSKVLPVTNLFNEHKNRILFTYRFLYGFRVIIPLVVGLSGVKPLQYLFYTVVTGLFWATTVSTVGYFIGRLFNVDVIVFEENLLWIVLGFASFGLVLGFVMNRFIFKRI